MCSSERMPGCAIAGTYLGLVLKRAGCVAEAAGESEKKLETGDTGQ